MDGWKQRSIGKFIQGSKGKGKSEVFINEFGILVDANGIPIYNTAGGGLISVDPDTMGVNVNGNVLNKGAQATLVQGATKQAPFGGSGVKNIWEELAQEPDIGYRAGPGIGQNSKLSPQEAQLLRKLYGFE